jgi:hypothetical protein
MPPLGGIRVKRIFNGENPEGLFLRGEVNYLRRDRDFKD